MKRFKFIKKNKLSLLPKTSGVYAFYNGKEILYIGKAANIRERVKNHFPSRSEGERRTNVLRTQTKEIGYIPTNSEIEALLLEAKLIKKHQPKFNIVWRDDKNYFYIAVTKEDYPRVFLTHQLKEKAEYIGPFTEGVALKRTLTYLRRAFPYYTAKSHPKYGCLWCSLKLCPGPNPQKSEYQKNIKNLIGILKGNSRKVLKDLKREMQKSSKRQEYEKAAKIRDKITSLKKVISHARIFEQPWLGEKDKSSSLPFAAARVIEAYDVSNIQGKEATGSMVTFRNGKPDKNFYRRFKIKIAGKPNDVAMIKEILKRRLKHQEWPLPDMILIDGGKPQLNAAKSVVKNKVKVMAIAKRKNELFLGDVRKPILLKTMPREIFNLILQLRDEAHRFAVSYHRKLRKRRLIPK